MFEFFKPELPLDHAYCFAFYYVWVAKAFRKKYGQNSATPWVDKIRSAFFDSYRRQKGTLPTFFSRLEWPIERSQCTGRETDCLIRQQFNLWS